MKLTCKFASLLFLLIFTGSAWAAVVDVPIVNSSFESPVVVGEQKVVADGWASVDSGEVYMYNDGGSDFAPVGDQVGAISSYSSGMKQVLTTNAQAGESYTISCWIWGQDATYQWTTLGIQAVDPSNPANTVVIVQRSDFGAYGWNFVTLSSGPVPANRDGWPLMVMLYGGRGWSYFDDVKITYEVPDPLSIYEAKQAANGASVITSGIVVGSFGSHFYIESTDRSCGIRVEGAGFAAVVGNKATVTGTMITRPDGEHCIAATDVTQTTDTELTPLAMNNRSAGGGDAGAQLGVDGGAGLNNIGLLAKTTGRVSAGVDNRFDLDDGSGVPFRAIIPATAGGGGEVTEIMIPNGSFEAPAIAGGQTHIYGTPADWTLVSGNADYVGVGNFYAPNPDGLAQFLMIYSTATQISTYCLDTLSEGRTYTFKLDFRKGSASSGASQMSVWAIRDKNDPDAEGGSRLLAVSYYDLINWGAWKEYSWSFNAPDGTDGWYVLIRLSGSGQWDHYDGLKLTSVATASSRPADGSYVTVTGAMSCYTDLDGKMKRQIEVMDWQEVQPAP